MAIFIFIQLAGSEIHPFTVDVGQFQSWAESATIRKGIYRSTLSVIGCRLTDEVALSACRCRVQICNRHCRIINEIYVTTLSVSCSQLQVCDK